MPRLTTLLLCVFAATLSAQTWTARHIVFKNPGTFSQAQLETACGMHAGQSVSAPAMQAAAQKLVDSGYFEDVGVVLDGTAANTSVVFTLKPLRVEDMLPLGFENFIWLTDAEIQQAIAARFPLYIGRLPEASPRADLVAAALTDALAAKGVPGAKVFYTSIEPTLLHPVRTTEFRITRTRVDVANVKLAGVSKDLVPLIQKSVNSTIGTSFNDGLNGILTRDIILKPLLDAGYINATLDNLSPQLQPLTASGTEPLIVSASLHSGEIFRISQIAFAGTSLYSEQAFSSSLKLKPADVASRALLLQSLQPIDDAYRKQGMIDVVVTAAPTLDSAAHTVAYIVGVVPGEVYRIHEVTAQNLTAAQQAAFTSNFRMRAGEVYNPFYTKEFLKNNTAITELLGCNGAFQATAFPVTHTVDLVVSFSCPVNVRG